MQIQLNPLNFLSESKRTPRPKPTKAPDWWNRLSKKQQENYAEKHPRTYLKDFIKKSDIERKKKAAQDTVRPSRVSKTKTKTQSKQVAPTGKFKTKAKPVKAALKEKLRRKEEDKIAADFTPTVKRSLTESIINLGTKISHVASSISNKMSPASKSSLSDFLAARKAGAKDQDTEKGRLVANKVLMSVVQVALLAAVVSTVAVGTGPLAGALVAAYLGFTDHKRALEGTKYENEATEEDDTTDEEPDDEDLVSTSALEEDDPVEELSQSFIEWLGNQDLDGISERIAQFAAIEKMNQDDWKPDVSVLDEEDLDAMLTSESGATPRLTFRISSNLKRKPEDQRSLFEIVYADRIIGRISSSTAFASKAQRIWVAELEDGFNESSYYSGKQESEPFTLVKKGHVLLKNPVKFTFSECCSWVKHNVDKNFL